MNLLLFTWFISFILGNEEFWAQVGKGMNFAFKADHTLPLKAGFPITTITSTGIGTTTTITITGSATLSSTTTTPFNPFCPPPPPTPEPFIETVRMIWRFTSSTALVLALRDTFCAGQKYRVRDNGVFLAFDFPDLPTICGVSTSSREIIYSPEFMETNYLLGAGYHNLSITIIGSQLGGGKSSMQIFLLPIGPIDPQIDAQLQFQEMCSMSKTFPAGTTLDQIDPS